MGDVTIGVGDLAVYAEDKLRHLFGIDPESLEYKQRMTRRWQIGDEQSRSVQCIGMDRPIPIEGIYQALRLHRAVDDWAVGKRISSITMDFLLERNVDAVIFAGPGRGKSTLLNWVFRKLLRSEKYSPFLFVLRAEGATEDLRLFVEQMAAGKKVKAIQKHKLVLLIDGYDEIPERERKSVSAVLAQFRANGLGSFYLTCRTYYEVYDLKAERYKLAEFTDDDSVHFVRAFAEHYDAVIDAEALVAEMKRRHLAEFAHHPLLLTLTCILKTGARPDLPQNALALLKRAFDTLTFRWDEQKGVSRQSDLPIDGEDRMSCTMHIAFHMRGLQDSSQHIELLAKQFLTISNAKKVEPRKLLLEIARWYGVLIQVDGDHWQFSHRCIHDYLAARFMVENGQFNPRTVRVWTSRYAYAACLCYDATVAMVTALERASDVQAFTECLYNRAKYDTRLVALAVIGHFRRTRSYLLRRSGARIDVQTDKDFFLLAPNQLLVDLAQESLYSRPTIRDSSEERSLDPYDAVFVYACGALHKRKYKLANPNAFKSARRAFRSADFIFQIGVTQPYEFKLDQIFSAAAKMTY